MERAILPIGVLLRWRSLALTLLGALLLAGALALGGGSALFVWALGGLATSPLRIAAVVALYLAPGLALLRLLWPRARPLAISARIALALCLSVALPPLLLLLAQLVGLPWGGATTWVYLFASLVLCLRWEIRGWRSSRRAPIANLPSLISLDGTGLALLGVSLAALLVRLYAARDLRVGLLGDSYHHTMMVQLLLDNSGLFHSWQPYAPLATFTYHFGFHANAAFVHYVAGIDAAPSVIWTGQILNALLAPAVFALMVGLGSSSLSGPDLRWAGVWAALLVGFVSNLPAFYVNWGRYTQMTGQIVATTAVVCWVALAETTTRDQGPKTKDQGPTAKGNQPGFLLFRRWSFVVGRDLAGSWRLVVLTALVTAALILTHYLVTALATLLIVSYLVVAVLARRSWPAAATVVLRALLAGTLAMLLVAPWLLNLLRGHLVRNATGMVNGGSGKAVIEALSALEPVVPKYASGAVLLVALAGLLVAGWRRDWRMALPAVWCALLVLAVVPYMIGLPGAGVIDNLTGLGSLFIPIALLAGYALASGQAQLARSCNGAGGSAETEDRGGRWAVDDGRWTMDDQPGAAAVSRRSSVVGRRSSLAGALAAVLMLAVIASNAGWQTRVVARDTALVTDADLAAIDWIRASTAPGARFLINSFPAYGGNLVAGTDAGWWLPLLAGRQVSVPPLTYGSEQGVQPDYQTGVNALAKKLRGRPLADPTPQKIDLSRPVALKALADNHFDYVYSGAHPYPGPAAADRFDTAKLRASPAFRLVYDRDGVEIFQFVGSQR